MITQGERTPAFTSNPEYQVTGVNYDQAPNRITVTGEKSLSSRGAQTRNDFGNGKFLPADYNPSTIFVRTIDDQQSILGAYAFLLGLYPDSADGITLEADVEALGDIPVKNFEVNSVRGNVRLGSPTKATTQAKLHPGNPDALFLTKLNELYPGVTKKVDQQLFDSKAEYEATHGTQFYAAFADAIHRPADNVNFYSVFRYADDILTSKANGKQSSVELSRDLMDKLSVYYGYYFGNGLFRDQALTRAFAHTYLSTVAHELQLKVEDDQTGKWSGQALHELKFSVYLSNHLTLLAALNLFNEIEDYHVDFNDELRFQLLKKDGKYVVRSSLNDKPLSLEGTADAHGDAEWSSWRDYVCSKLYYGDLTKVRSGAENPSEHVRIQGSCASFLSSAFYVGDKVQLKDHDKPPAAPEQPTPLPVTQTAPRAEPAGAGPSSSGADVRSQSVDIKAARTTNRVQYPFFKPIKLQQTKTKPFELPMKKGFSFDNLNKKTVSINQFRKIKIGTTTNIPVSLAQTRTINFESDLLKTREVSFNHADLIQIPQMSSRRLFLADKHQFSWGENPSFSSKGDVKFNHYFKIKIPVTVPKELTLPEVTAFNYNTNSLDVKKVNFNHIKSVRVHQVTDVVKPSITNADTKTTQDSQAQSNPIPKTTSVPAKSTQGVSLGGNTSTENTQIAPIRIKQEYNPTSTGSTTSSTSASPSLKPAAEPAPSAPSPTASKSSTSSTSASSPSSTSSSSSYIPPKTYPAYSSDSGSQPSTSTSSSTPASSSTSTSSSTPKSSSTSTSSSTTTASPQPAATTTQPSSSTTTSSTAYRPASSSTIPARKYPSYSSYSSTRA
jgi:hypothetical protein